jgi:hypothetical protein
VLWGSLVIRRWRAASDGLLRRASKHEYLQSMRNWLDQVSIFGQLESRKHGCERLETQEGCLALQ